MTVTFDVHVNMAKRAKELLVQAVTHDENHNASLALAAYDSAITALLEYLDKFATTSVDFRALTTDEQKIVRERVEKAESFLGTARQRKQALTSPPINKTVVEKKLRTYEAQPLGTVLEQKRQIFLQQQQQQQQQQEQQQQQQQHGRQFQTQPLLRQTARQPQAQQFRTSVQRKQPFQDQKRRVSPTAPVPAVPFPPRQVQPRLPPSPPAAIDNKPSDPLRQNIENEILDTSPNVQWDDIYGLGDVKDALNEMMILPAQRPDLYSGLRAPGKGVLLAGPPGVGKTLIAKAVATNIGATFFSISASSLNSKYHGESERLVRTLFQIARERQPSFIFIDEIDSILGSRSESEHEASRRLKTEFMVQFDGSNSSSSGSNGSSNSKGDGSNNNNVGSTTVANQNISNVASGSDRVYIMAATNRPQDLDDAVLRRFDRRIYVPLPNEEGRQTFLKKLIQKDDGIKWNVSQRDFEVLAKRTFRFSGSDMKALCRETSLMPLRELGDQVSEIKAEDVRACEMIDFERAFSIVRPSSNEQLIDDLEKWNDKFGSKAMFKSFDKLVRSKSVTENEGEQRRCSNNEGDLRRIKTASTSGHMDDLAVSAASDEGSDGSADDSDHKKGHGRGFLAGFMAKRKGDDASPPRAKDKRGR